MDLPPRLTSTSDRAVSWLVVVMISLFASGGTVWLVVASPGRRPALRKHRSPTVGPRRCSESSQRGVPCETQDHGSAMFKSRRAAMRTAPAEARGMVPGQMVLLSDESDHSIRELRRASQQPHAPGARFSQLTPQLGPCAPIPFNTHALLSMVIMSGSAQPHSPSRFRRALLRPLSMTRMHRRCCGEYCVSS